MRKKLSALLTLVMVSGITSDSYSHEDTGDFPLSEILMATGLAMAGTAGVLEESNGDLETQNLALAGGTAFLLGIINRLVLDSRKKESKDGASKLDSLSDAPNIHVALAPPSQNRPLGLSVNIDF